MVHLYLVVSHSFVGFKGDFPCWGKQCCKIRCKDKCAYIYTYIYTNIMIHEGIYKCWSIYIYFYIIYIGVKSHVWLNVTLVYILVVHKKLFRHINAFETLPTTHSWHYYAEVLYNFYVKNCSANPATYIAWLEYV